MVRVKNYKFTNPLSSEFRRQLSFKLKKECRHLKGIREVIFFDHQNDEVYYEPACKQCNKILDSDEIKQIELTLQKYGVLRYKTK